MFKIKGVGCCLYLLLRAVESLQVKCRLQFLRLLYLIIVHKWNWWKQTYSAMFTCLQKFYPLSDEFCTLMSEYSTCKELAKGEILIAAGNKCSNLYLIIDGFCLCYFEKDGREHVLCFFEEGERCTPFHCFEGKKESFVNVVATEKTTVLCISREHFKRLWRISPEFVGFVYLLIEKSVLECEEMYYQIRSRSTLERVRYCMETHKYQALIKKIPQYRIASYLCMTPENFTKVLRCLNGRE